MAKIGADIKKLQEQKQALTKEFQEKNKQIFAERTAKMAELQKARLE
jgi:DNA anti-recombination protein RmuC